MKYMRVTAATTPAGYRKQATVLYRRHSHEHYQTWTNKKKISSAHLCRQPRTSVAFLWAGETSLRISNSEHQPVNAHTIKKNTNTNTSESTNQKPSWTAAVHHTWDKNKHRKCFSFVHSRIRYEDFRRRISVQVCYKVYHHTTTHKKNKHRQVRSLASYEFPAFLHSHTTHVHVHGHLTCVLEVAISVGIDASGSSFCRKEKNIQHACSKRMSAKKNTKRAASPISGKSMKKRPRWT